MSILFLFTVTLFFTSGCHWAMRPFRTPVAPSISHCRELTQQGQLAADSGDWQRAQKLFQAALTRCSEDPDAQRMYAESLWQQGNANAAKRELAQAVNVVPDDPLIRLRYAEISFASDDIVTAEQQVTQAIELSPKLADAWRLKAKIADVRKDYQSALIAYHRALSLQGNDYETLVGLAEIHRKLNQPRQALGTLQMLTSSYLPGTEPQALLYLMGLAYAEVQQYEEAIIVYSRAIQQGSPNVEMWYHLAEAQLKAGYDTQAVSALRQSLQIEPRHPPSLALLQRLEVAQRLRMDELPR